MGPERLKMREVSLKINNCFECPFSCSKVYERVGYYPKEDRLHLICCKKMIENKNAKLIYVGVIKEYRESIPDWCPYCEEKTKDESTER